MNSGVLPLKTRRKVSLAPEGAGVESAADAARQATPINRKNRRREVFIESIRCAATHRALCLWFESRLLRLRRPRARQRTAASFRHFCAAARTAAGPGPPANGTMPRLERPRHPTVPE